MGRPRLAWLVAPALLVAVATGQIALALSADLTAWLGGGFGMFATIDSPGERHLVFYVDSPGLVREVILPEDLEECAARVRALPTATRMRILGEEILARERERIRDIERVRVQLWRTGREPGTLAPVDRFVAEVRVPTAGGRDG